MKKKPWLFKVEHEGDRQTCVDVNQTAISLSHTGNILDNNEHRLDGTAFGSKQFGGPVTVGGNLDYSHKPTGSELSLGASNTIGYGTDVTAQGKYNLYHSPGDRTTAHIGAQYSRHFGGPQGTGKPNHGAFVGFKHRF